MSKVYFAELFERQARHRALGWQGTLQTRTRIRLRGNLLRGPIPVVVEYEVWFMLETPVLVEADGSIPGAAGAVAHLDNEDGPEELRQISKSFETAAERHAWIQNHFVLEP